MYLINLQSKESIYEQIKKQIIRFVDIGILKPNDKLPSVRMLASDLSINPNTVQRAYEELEKEGIIYTLNKKGAFVAEKDKITTSKDKQILFTLDSYKQEGISKEELLSLIEKVYKEDSNVKN